MKIIHRIGQIITFASPVGVLGTSLLNLTNFQRQILMLILLVWVNTFFLFKSWSGQ
jgi:hypothetical protein